FGARLARGANDAFEVAASAVEIEAAQGVVAAKLDDHQRRRVALEQAGNSRGAAGGGLSADTRVDDAPAAGAGLQAGFEQRHPARAALEAILGGQTVAEH